MAEVADGMIDGSACALCGMYLGDYVGYARACDGCSGVDPREESKARRAENRKHSAQVLRDLGYMFEEHNGGAHLIVTTAIGLVDFWPGTGKFICRCTNKKGRGVTNLMKHAASLDRPSDLIEIQWKPHMSRFAITTYAAAGYTVVGAPEESK